MIPAGVAATKVGSPWSRWPALSGWKPSTSLIGEIARMTFRVHVRGSGGWRRMPVTRSSALAGDEGEQLLLRSRQELVVDRLDPDLETGLLRRAWPRGDPRRQHGGDPTGSSAPHLADLSRTPRGGALPSASRSHGRANQTAGIRPRPSRALVRLLPRSSRSSSGLILWRNVAGRRLGARGRSPIGRGLARSSPGRPRSSPGSAAGRSPRGIRPRTSSCSGPTATCGIR
jgi:hypothetical protein